MCVGQVISAEPAAALPSPPCRGNPALPPVHSYVCGRTAACVCRVDMWFPFHPRAQQLAACEGEECTSRRTYVCI